MIANRRGDGNRDGDCYNQRMAPPTRRPRPRSSIEILYADNLHGLDWLLHGFSTRGGGVSQAYGGGALNLGFTADDSRSAVERNRRTFIQSLGAVNGGGRAWPLAGLRQIHSSLIHEIRTVARKPVHGDGMVTARRGVLLGVKTADCLPILLADRRQRAIAALHAGWRGTLGRIVEKGVGEMRRRYDSRPDDLLAAIGPGIHRCCYQVGEEVRDKFLSQFAYAPELFDDVFDSDPVRKKYPLLFLNQRAPGHGDPPRSLHLDLVEANRRQLLSTGVPAENITASELCTSCRTDLLFSHRKEKGVTGRMLAVIGIR